MRNLCERVHHFPLTHCRKETWATAFPTPSSRSSSEGDVPEAVELAVKWVATPRPCSVVGQGCNQEGGEPPMAKHDRRKSSGQPPSSQPVTIQVPLPVLGVVNGVREAFHGLCIATGLQVLEAMMEGDREVLCGPKGRQQVERTAWRGGSADSQVALGGRQVEVPRLRVRSADGEVPLVSFRMGGGNRPAGRAHAGGGRRRGVDAAVCEHVGPGAGRRDRAGDLEQCRVAAVRGAVDEAPRGVSRAAVGGAGPAGGLHRRQGVPGPLHGGRVGDRRRGPETRAGVRQANWRRMAGESPAGGRNNQPPSPRVMRRSP